MTISPVKKVGFTCAYAPLPLIDAAGFVPYRILPSGDVPDRAGAVLHDNMCPHVKRILDRALAEDLPGLSGVVVMNSCDTMRRLADAWQVALPADRVILVDLPTSADDGSVKHLARELGRLAGVLREWGGRAVRGVDVIESVRRYRDLALVLTRLTRPAGAGALPGGRRAIQELLNRSVTTPVEKSLEDLRLLEAGLDGSPANGSGVPLFLFGNVLAEPDAFALFESCGGRVAGDDLCTGARQLVPISDVDDPDEALHQLARSILIRPVCARTIVTGERDRLVEQVVAGARDCGARGVVAHVMKFCDPYLARLPSVRRGLDEAGLPLLVLEGDCTMRSLGQHATRIEAFVEMIGESGQ